MTVSVFDSNGNCYNIGTATTDMSGTYSLTWKPEVSGNYTVMANFAGTNGYWPSSSETTFNTMETPTATTTPTSVQSSNAETYVIYFGIATIIAIFVVGAILALLLLRKRP